MNFRIGCCSFTTYLSSRVKLTVLFVCYRTVRMAAIYQLKIKYDQDKFGAVFLREHPSENHAVLKYGSTSTLSDFVQILCRVSL